MDLLSLPILVQQPVKKNSFTCQNDFFATSPTFGAHFVSCNFSEKKSKEIFYTIKVIGKLKYISDT